MNRVPDQLFILAQLLICLSIGLLHARKLPGDFMARPAMAGQIALAHDHPARYADG